MLLIVLRFSNLIQRFYFVKRPSLEPIKKSFTCEGKDARGGGLTGKIAKKTLGEDWRKR